MSDISPAPATVVAQALRLAREAGLDRLDSELLMAEVLARPRTWLLAHDTDPIDAQALARFMALVQRRANGEPAAYLLGHKEFFGLSLAVTPDVLVPRPDTEILVEWALDTLPLRGPGAQADVLDLGTGSGAIALAIQQQRPQARVTAVDASPGALGVAQANAKNLQLPIELLLGSWLEPVVGRRFDLIVSNPPYIAEGDPHMAALCHEPKQALTSGSDGLDDIRHIVEQAPPHLQPGGWLLFEHGWDQAEAVADLLRARGFAQVTSRLDLGGHQRCTGGQTPK